MSNRPQLPSDNIVHSLHRAIYYVLVFCSEPDKYAYTIHHTAKAFAQIMIRKKGKNKCATRLNTEMTTCVITLAKTSLNWHSDNKLH